jgi:hypothetical protein
MRWAIPHRAVEAALLAAHAAGYLCAVFLILSPAKAMAFVVVQQGLFGFYMGCTFAPNHKGMAILQPPTPQTFSAVRCSPPAMCGAVDSSMPRWVA